MQNVMDFSVALVGLLCLVFLTVRYAKAQMKKLGVDFDGYKKIVMTKVEPIADRLFVSLVVAMLISLIISMVSFRQLWSNDVFHVVFIAYLLRGSVEKLVREVV